MSSWLSLVGSQHRSSILGTSCCGGGWHVSLLMFSLSTITPVIVVVVVLLVQWSGSIKPLRSLDCSALQQFIDSSVSFVFTSSFASSSLLPLNSKQLLLCAASLLLWLFVLLLPPLSQRHFLVGSSSRELSGVVGVRARRWPTGDPRGLRPVRSSSPRGETCIPGASSSPSRNHRCCVHSLAVILSLQQTTQTDSICEHSKNALCGRRKIKKGARFLTLVPKTRALWFLLKGCMENTHTQGTGKDTNCNRKENTAPSCFVFKLTADTHAH